MVEEQVIVTVDRLKIATYEALDLYLSRQDITKKEFKEIIRLTKVYGGVEGVKRRIENEIALERKVASMVVDLANVNLLKKQIEDLERQVTNGDVVDQEHISKLQEQYKLLQSKYDSEQVEHGKTRDDLDVLNEKYGPLREHADDLEQQLDSEQEVHEKTLADLNDKQAYTKKLERQAISEAKIRKDIRNKLNNAKKELLTQSDVDAIVEKAKRGMLTQAESDAVVSKAVETTEKNYQKYLSPKAVENDYVSKSEVDKKIQEAEKTLVSAKITLLEGQLEVSKNDTKDYEERATVAEAEVSRLEPQLVELNKQFEAEVEIRAEEISDKIMKDILKKQAES